jgi:hypothetical protein
MKFMMLAQDIEQSAPVTAEFKRILAECKVKLPPAKKAKGHNYTTKSFSQQVKQARSSPHLICIHAASFLTYHGQMQVAPTQPAAHSQRPPQVL